MRSLLLVLSLCLTGVVLGQSVKGKFESSNSEVSVNNGSSWKQHSIDVEIIGDTSISAQDLTIAMSNLPDLSAKGFQLLTRKIHLVPDSFKTDSTLSSAVDILIKDSKDSDGLILQIIISDSKGELMKHFVAVNYEEKKPKSKKEDAYWESFDIKQNPFVAKLTKLSSGQFDLEIVGRTKAAEEELSMPSNSGEQPARTEEESNEGPNEQKEDASSDEEVLVDTVKAIPNLIAKYDEAAFVAAFITVMADFNYDKSEVEELAKTVYQKFITQKLAAKQKKDEAHKKELKSRINELESETKESAGYIQLARLDGRIPVEIRGPAYNSCIEECEREASCKTKRKCKRACKKNNDSRKPTKNCKKNCRKTSKGNKKGESVCLTGCRGQDAILMLNRVNVTIRYNVLYDLFAEGRVYLGTDTFDVEVNNNLYGMAIHQFHRHSFEIETSAGVFTLQCKDIVRFRADSAGRKEKIVTDTTFVLYPGAETYQSPVHQYRFKDYVSVVAYTNLAGIVNPDFKSAISTQARVSIPLSRTQHGVHSLLRQANLHVDLTEIGLNPVVVELQKGAIKDKQGELTGDSTFFLNQWDLAARSIVYGRMVLAMYSYDAKYLGGDGRLDVLLGPQAHFTNVTTDASSSERTLISTYGLNASLKYIVRRERFGCDFRFGYTLFEISPNFQNVVSSMSMYEGGVYRPVRCPGDRQLMEYEFNFYKRTKSGRGIFLRLLGIDSWRTKGMNYKVLIGYATSVSAFLK